jgi:hypothetical protein
MMRGIEDPSLLWSGRLGTLRRKCSGFEVKARAPGTKAERRRHEQDISKVESPLKGRSLSVGILCVMMVKVEQLSKWSPKPRAGDPRIHRGWDQRCIRRAQREDVEDKV